MKPNSIFWRTIIILLIFSYNKAFSSVDSADLREIVIHKILSKDFSDFTANEIRFHESHLNIDEFRGIVEKGYYFKFTTQKKIYLNEKEIEIIKSHFENDSLFNIPFNIKIYYSVLEIFLNGIKIHSFTVHKCKINAIPEYNDKGEVVGYSNEFISFPHIENCNIQNLNITSNLTLEKNDDILIELTINKSTIKTLNISGLISGGIYIKNSYLSEVSLRNISSNNVELENNTFDINHIKNSKKNNDVIEPEEFGKYFRKYFNDIVRVEFSNNERFLFNGNKSTKSIEIEGNSKRDFAVFIQGKSYQATISNNIFETGLSLNYYEIEKSFKFNENIFEKIALNKFIFPELNNEIYWDGFENFKISFLPSSELPYISQGKWYDFTDTLAFEGNSTISKATFKDFRILIKVYQTLYDIYKINGDIESANSCYAEMKQVETKRWEYIHNQNKSFESFFRWQLNGFLSYFTDYGTNPAKAVIKSFWVIIIFAVFYLFFPSDWDITNRAEFLKRFKNLLSKQIKDEKQKSAFAFYFTNISYIVYSGFIHILNALTLSLNAFTTLGFGDIPTRGAARYVTILQGFIGWFLLTIFSVSLINQVLG